MHQYAAISSYEQQRQVPVYYLRYNPLTIPSSTIIPLAPDPTSAADQCEVSCRAVPARDLRQLLTGRPDGTSPSYGELAAGITSSFASVPSAAG